MESVDIAVNDRGHTQGAEKNATKRYKQTAAHRQHTSGRDDVTPSLYVIGRLGRLDSPPRQKWTRAAAVAFVASSFPDTILVWSKPFGQGTRRRLCSVLGVTGSNWCWRSFARGSTRASRPRSLLLQECIDPPSLYNRKRQQNNHNQERGAAWRGRARLVSGMIDGLARFVGRGMFFFVISSVVSQPTVPRDLPSGRISVKRGWLAELTALLRTMSWASIPRHDVALATVYCKKYRK